MAVEKKKRHADRTVQVLWSHLAVAMGTHVHVLPRNSARCRYQCRQKKMRRCVSRFVLSPYAVRATKLYSAWRKEWYSVSSADAICRVLCGPQPFMWPPAGKKFLPGENIVEFAY